MNSISKIPSGITNDIYSSPRTENSVSYGDLSSSTLDSSSRNSFFSFNGKTNYTKLGLVVIILLETTKDVTSLTAEGAKLGVDVAAGTIESGIDVIQGQLDLEQSSKPVTPKQQQASISASLTSALADAEENTDPLPDDATSSTQRNGSNKSGYCYIGEDRGFRSCIYVKENDACMSGDIFPSQDLCVNPSLRE